MYQLIFTLILAISLISCQPAQHDHNKQSSDTQAIESSKLALRLESHMSFLASDLLKGRQTASHEYNIAASYVATQLQSYGLKPAGENDGWYQQVPFVTSSLVKDSMKFSVVGPNEQFEFNYVDDYIISANPHSTSSLVTAELVFVGYGIESDSLNHHDYSNLDVNNKIAVMLSGRPSSFPSEQGAHLSSGATKAQTAVANGAIGIIRLETPMSAKRFPFKRAKNYAYRDNFKWKSSDGKVSGSFEQLKGGALLSMVSAKRLFNAGGHDLDAIYTQLDNNEVPNGFEMGVQATLESQSTHETTYSPNVVAILEGSDPVLKSEYVVYSAHLDHVGDDYHGDEKHGDDKLNNGALDNASGVSIMLETARRFSLNQQPKRSILFVAVTGEEKGLLGSSYYAENATVPVQQMVANINLDMPLILYPFEDVVAFGSEHTTLANHVEKAAAKQGITLSPDPMPEQSIFVRSDHYSFVKKGIPSIFLMPGFKSKDPNIDGAKVFKEFLKEHYHKPSDDLNLGINYQAGAVFTVVNYDIGNEVANAKSKPRWHEGDYFGDLFAGNQDANEEDTLKQRLKTK